MEDIQSVVNIQSVENIEIDGNNPFYYALHNALQGAQQGQEQGIINELFVLLKEWGLECAYNNLIAKGINIGCLHLLTERDLDKIFQLNELGILVQFRDKLCKWKSEHGYINTLDESGSLVEVWLKKIYHCVSSPSSSSTSFSTELPIESPSSLQSFAKRKEFDLDSYLNGPGKCIWNTYEKNSRTLLPACREKLVKDVVKHYADQNTFLHDEDFNRLAENIKNKFEKEQKEIYYCKRNKYPSGRLYTAYKNHIHKLRKVGLFPREKQHKKKRLNLNEIVISDVEQPTDAQIWLKHHTEPWEVVEVKWKETGSLREKHFHQPDKNISTIISNWPLYKSANGARLIDIDFSFLFPDKGDILFEKWDTFTEQIIPIFEQHLKDKSTKSALKELNSIKDKEQQNLKITRLLHGLLIPNGKAKNKVTKKIWKFSILDSQEAFVSIVETFNNFKPLLDKRKKTYVEYGLTCQPMILVVGNDDSYKEYYTIYDDIIYKFNKFTHALSCAFKIHYVFNLTYQEECKTFWTFIQSYFFEIQDRQLISIVSSLISLLQK